jgi:hypothetical protein
VHPATQAQLLRLLDHGPRNRFQRSRTRRAPLVLM